MKSCLMLMVFNVGLVFASTEIDSKVNQEADLNIKTTSLNAIKKLDENGSKHEKESIDDQITDKVKKNSQEKKAGLGLINYHSTFNGKIPSLQIKEADKKIKNSQEKAELKLVNSYPEAHKKNNNNKTKDSSESKVIVKGLVEKSENKSIFDKVCYQAEVIFNRIMEWISQFFGAIIQWFDKDSSKSKAEISQNDNKNKVLAIADKK